MNNIDILSQFGEWASFCAIIAWISTNRYQNGINITGLIYTNTEDIHDSVSDHFQALKYITLRVNISSVLFLGIACIDVL